MVESTVGFGQINVELYPELVFDEVKSEKKPNQLIIANGLTKKWAFSALEGESNSDTVERLVKDI